MHQSIDLPTLVLELRERFPRYPIIALNGLVARCHEPFREAAVQSFVPVLVRREALAQLRYLEEGQAGEVVSAARSTRGGRLPCPAER